MLKLILVSIMLAGIFLGGIYYKNALSGSEFIVELNVCQDMANKLQCWEALVDSTLEKEGLDASFELIANLYDNEPTFASDCHSFVHKLGQKAYQQFSTHQDFNLSSKSSYCGYGFYHGFMETLIQQGGDLSKAREFCNFAEAQIDQKSYAKGACYHGIGHGFTDGSDPRAYGDAQALIDPALKLCNQVGDTDILRRTCAGGVFNSLAIMYTDSKYKLQVNKNYPFEVCQKQKEDYFKIACFGQMNTLIISVADNDFSKAVSLISLIADDQYAATAIDSLASAWAQFGATSADQDRFISVCHSLRSPIQVSCIKGLGAGLVEFGQPLVEYIGAVNFCQRQLLSEEEKKGCFHRVFDYFTLLYNREKIDSICQTVPEENRKYCRKV